MEAGSGRSGCAQGAEKAKQQTLATLVPHAVPAHAPSDAFDDLVLSDVHIGRAVDLELGSDGAAGASCPPTAVADAATDATRCVLAPASFCRDSKRHTTTFLFVTPPPPVCSMAAPSVRSKRRRTESSGGRDDVVAVEVGEHCWVHAATLFSTSFSVFCLVVLWVVGGLHARLIPMTMLWFNVDHVLRQSGEGGKSPCGMAWLPL